MSMTDMMVRQYDYSCWARDKILEQAHALSEQQFHEESQFGTLYEKATSGGTKRAVTTWSLIGNQGRLHIAPGFPLGLGWDWTIQKLAGTDRSFTWTIRRTN